VDASRDKPTQNHNLATAGQVKDLLARLPERGAEPLFVFDAG
jgi:hypothetical protein